MASTVPELAYDSDEISEQSPPGEPACAHGRTEGLPDFVACTVILHAAMGETSLNCWKLSVISVFSRSAWVVESPSSVEVTSWPE